MSIIRVLQHHVRSTPSTHPSGFDIDRDAFKVIYVAPMKALAAEITRKFGKRLAWLGIKVRELTGDMQLTKQEIAETHTGEVGCRDAQTDGGGRAGIGENDTESHGIFSRGSGTVTDASTESQAANHRRGASPERRARRSHRDHRGEDAPTSRVLPIAHPDRRSECHAAKLHRRQRLPPVSNSSLRGEHSIAG
jgi:hypothetical protein